LFNFSELQETVTFLSQIHIHFQYHFHSKCLLVDHSGSQNSHKLAGSTTDAAIFCSHFHGIDGKLKSSAVISGRSILEGQFDSEASQIQKSSVNQIFDSSQDQIQT
jgi:hypothetical protein